MAIPFNLPSDEETENNYRSMDDLLVQLYRVLRQILLHRVPAQETNNQHDPTHEQNNVEADALPLPDVVPRLPLPDVVACPHPHPRPPPRRGRRRRTQRRPPGEEADKQTTATTTTATPRGKVEMRDSWTQVGEDLRQIADDFGTTLQDIDPKRLDSSANQKGIGFLSLLVPPPFRGSIWMAVVFLFGWGALHRSR